MLAPTTASRANWVTSKTVSTVAYGVCPVNSDKGASNCGKHGIPIQSNPPLKARSWDSSGGVSWDVLSRRPCDGKLVSEIYFAHSVKLISNPCHVLVCSSEAWEIRSSHCVNTRDSQVHHFFKLLVPSKTCLPCVEPLDASIKSSTYTKHWAVSKCPQARLHGRLFTSHFRRSVALAR